MVQEKQCNIVLNGSSSPNERKSHASTPRCLISGDSSTPLLRFVNIGNDQFFYDPFEKLEGPFFHLKADSNLIKEHYQNGGFGDQYPLSLSEMLEKIEYMLGEKLYQQIALAKKSGTIISGFMKVKEALEQKKLILVLIPIDVQASDKEKIQSRAKDIEYPFYGEQKRFEQILTKKNVVYIGFLDTSLNKDIKIAIKTLENLRISKNHAI